MSRTLSRSCTSRSPELNGELASFPAPNIHLGPPANSGPISGGEDDLERPRQGSVLDLGCFAQAHGDPLALVRRKPAIDAVALVAGFPGEVHLRRQQLVPVAAHLDMDVRGPPRVGHRADGAEPVATARVGQRAAVALEARVGRLALSA